MKKEVGFITSSFNHQLRYCSSTPEETAPAPQLLSQLKLSLLKMLRHLLKHQKKHLQKNNHLTSN